MNRYKQTILIQVDYASGTRRGAVGGVDIDHAGEVWEAVRRPVYIDTITTTESGEATGQRITFTELTSADVAEVLTDKVRGLPVKIWLADLDDNNRVIGTPVQLIDGVSDTPQIVQSADSLSTLSWAIESYAVFWARVNGGRMTDAEQRSRHPGDAFFSFVGEEWTSAWPNKDFYRL